MKKRHLFIGLLVIVAVIFLTGCKKENKFKLEVTESSWSGWSENYKPEEKTYYYDIVLDKEYSSESGRFKFKVIEVNKDNIVVKTTEVYSDKEEGIDLNTKKTEFTIYLNKKTTLTTPTMDEGDIYYLTLKK